MAKVNKKETTMDASERQQHLGNKTPLEFIAEAARWDRICDGQPTRLDVGDCKQIHAFIQQQSAEIERLTKAINDGDYAGLRELALIREVSGHMKVGLCDLAEAVGKDYAELATLREVVGVTADGVPLSECEYVWLAQVGHPDHPIRCNEIIYHTVLEQYFVRVGDTDFWVQHYCYSTRAAATAALEAESNQQKESE